MIKTETKILTGILIFSILLIGGAVLLLSSSSTPQTSIDSSQVYQVDYSKGQKIGSDSAKLRLVEFSDLQCPACQAYEPYVKQALSEYKDDIQLIYRHFPLSQHIHARAAANFAEYAGTAGKFWEVHDKLFETQQQWAVLKDPTDFFVGIGKEFGLDESKVKESITKSPYNDKINQDIEDGGKVNVDSTPTFLLNGRKLQMQNFGDLKQALDQEFKK